MVCNKNLSISDILSIAKYMDENGLIGNKLSTKRLRRFDSILNEVKYNNYFEIGREYDAFIKNKF